MNDSRRYRFQAPDCLSAAQEAERPCDRKLRLSMANSWFWLARRDEAMDKLLPSGDTNEPIKTDLVLGTASNPFDLPPRRTILDIGVGGGHFLALCDALHACLGIDTNRPADAQARFTL